MNTTEHHVVQGSPGTGKTLVMLHRARHLIDRHQLHPDRVRLFVFTATIKTYIQPALCALNIPEDCVKTYDQWCLEFFNSHIEGVVPWNKGPDYDAIRAKVWEHVQARPIKTLDCALVDEGHDLDPTVFKILKIVSRHVTVFIDNKQQLFDTGSSVQSVANALDVHGRNETLNDTYRCSPYIVQTAASFISSKAEREHFIEQNQSGASGERQKPHIYIGNDHESVLDRLIDVIRTCVDRGDRVGILFPNRRHVYGYVRSFQEAGIDVEVPPTSGKTNRFQTPHDFETLRPKVMAYPSAKGLTFDVVLIPFLSKDQFPPRIRVQTLERWLFVAITRAVRWVYIGATRGVLFEERFERLETEGQLSIERGQETIESVNLESNDRVSTNDLSDLF